LFPILTIFIYYLFLGDPIYRAKATTYFTRTIGCFGLTIFPPVTVIILAVILAFGKFSPFSVRDVMVAINYWK